MASGWTSSDPGRNRASPGRTEQRSGLAASLSETGQLWKRSSGLRAHSGQTLDAIILMDRQPVWKRRHETGQTLDEHSSGAMSFPEGTYPGRPRLLRACRRPGRPTRPKGKAAGTRRRWRRRTTTRTSSSSTSMLMSLSWPTLSLHTVYRIAMRCLLLAGDHFMLFVFLGLLKAVVPTSSQFNLQTTAGWIIDLRAAVCVS